MNVVKSCCLGLLFGVKDSLLGIVLLSNIDKKENKESESTRPPARRGARNNRADKKKNDLNVFTIHNSVTGVQKIHVIGKGRVLPMMAQCCFLNGGVLLLSVMIFERYIVPAVKFLMAAIANIVMAGNDPQSFIWSWMEPTMKYTFRYLWVVPLFWLCKILNVFWFVEIADTAYRIKFGRPISSLILAKDSWFKVISKTMADFVFSINVEIFFLLQAQLVGLIPVLGPPLSFLHMCLLYSLYAFEYTWSNYGWTVVRRISHIENNWPYFIGFGFLLSVLTSISSSTVISACIFGISFPIFILSGLDAKPYEECDYPLRVFSFVIWLTNKVFLLRASLKKRKSDSEVS